MKKTYLIAASCSVLLLTACGGNAAEEATTEEATTETASAEGCDNDAMMAKAQKVGEKAQGLASDPEGMQELMGKMQKIQEEAQAGVADGSYTLQQACDAYDQLLAD